MFAGPSFNTARAVWMLLKEDKAPGGTSHFHMC